MKVLKKVVIYPLIVVLILVSILVTVYLLNFNRYNVSEIGDRSFLIMDDDIADFKKDDLVVVKKNNNEDIKSGDYIFFYDVSSEENLISYGKVNSKTKVNEDETTFTMNNNFPISSDYVIGKEATSTSFGSLGMVLSILSSQFGFLFLILLPIAGLFIYQIYLFILELKKEKA